MEQICFVLKIFGYCKCLIYSILFYFLLQINLSINVLNNIQQYLIKKFLPPSFLRLQNKEENIVLEKLLILRGKFGKNKKFHISERYKDFMIHEALCIQLYWWKTIWSLESNVTHQFVKKVFLVNLYFI